MRGFAISEFIPKQPSRKNSRFVGRLRRILAEKGIKLNKYSPSKWADDFRKLQEVDGISEQQTQAALDWLAVQIGTKYCPHVRSAMSFRAKFPQIVECMERSSETRTMTAEPGPDAIRLSKELALLWPGEEKAKEAQFIQAGIDNITQFKSELAQLASNSDADKRFQEYARYIRSKMPHTFHAIEHWTRFVHHLAWHWPKWKGNLHKWVWSYTASQFTELGRKWTQEWSGNPNRWAEIETAIKQLRCEE